MSGHLLIGNYFSFLVIHEIIVYSIIDGILDSMRHNIEVTYWLSDSPRLEYKLRRAGIFLCLKSRCVPNTQNSVWHIEATGQMCVHQINDWMNAWCCQSASSLLRQTIHTCEAAPSSCCCCCCSVIQSCPTLCDPTDCSTSGLSVPHHLLALAQTRIHWVGDAIQPSCPLPSPSPLAFNLSQLQGLL